MLNDKYFLWGAGTYGSRLINYLGNDLTFEAVIDNNPSKQGSVFCGLPVVGYNKVEGALSNSKIVVALNVPTAVRDFLLSEGFIENKDFYIIHSFLPRYFWNKNKSIVIKSADIVATTMCNLKCNGCQAFIPLAPNPKHISTESILHDVDLLFNHIDAVLNINFCVGESLLNADLAMICEYIHVKYEGRYNYMLIQTNGSIVPCDEAFQHFSKLNVQFGLSDYPECRKTKERFIEKCETYNIQCYSNSSGSRELWYDFGDPRIIRETRPDKLRLQFAKCWQPGMALVNGYLYICAAQAWAHVVAKTGLLDEGDAFDLRSPMSDESREKLYKIVSRQPPEAGYVSHCMRCQGVMTQFKSERRTSA